MNIIKQYLAEVSGVDIFAIVSMIIFIVVFILMVTHTFSLRKAEIKEFKNLPLEDDQSEPIEENKIMNQ